jgi:muconate cycloisomerase
MRVDANEAWSAANAIEHITALKPFKVSAVEQPVPHAEVDACAEIRRATGVPVMLDESLCSLSDAERAIERQTADLFNLRLSKCGGFIPSLRLAHRAAARTGLSARLPGRRDGAAVRGRTSLRLQRWGLRYREGSYDAYSSANG